MNILFIENRANLIEDMDCGASVRSSALLNALTRFAQVDVISFVRKEKFIINNATVVFSDSLANEKGNRFTKLLALSIPWRPEKVYTVNKQKEKTIDDIVLRKPYDIIVMRYMQDAIMCGLLKYSEKLVIDIDDDPVEQAIMGIKLAKTIRNKIYNHVYAMVVKHVMEEVLCICRASFYSSPFKCPSRKSTFLPNISLGNSHVDKITNKTPHHLLIIGAFGWHPNAIGTSHFIKSIFPKIHGLYPDVELHIVGRCDQELMMDWEKNSGVKVLGYVPDITSEYENSRLVVVPLYQGTGTSIKVVEAMRIGRPIVSTPIGVRGMEKILESNNDFLLANTDDEFVQHIIRLLNDIDYSNRLIQNASLKYQEYFSNEAFDSIVKHVLI